MAFDWNVVDREFHRHARGLEVGALDRGRIEAFAAGIAAGRYSAEANRVSAEIRPVGERDVDLLERFTEARLARYRARGEAAIGRRQVAVAVLNGGMATRFGGEVKGIMPALRGRSFLEIKLAQTRRLGAIPFLVMNSVATDERTRAFLRERGLAGDVQCFLQGVSLRLTPDGELFRDRDGAISWYATGHGDFPQALRGSGTLARLRAQGVEVVLLSNVDNLGAEPDPVIIGYHLSHGDPLTVEVARTRPGDVGGAPFFVGDSLRVVEGFCLPEDFDPARLEFFNTNSFAISLAVLEHDHPLTWYYVEKQVGGRVAVQMERLVNELSRFVATRYLATPRSGPAARFIPVKTQDDLRRLQATPELVQRFAADL